MTSPRRLHWLMLGSHVPAGGSLGGVVRYTVELARALAERDDVRLSVLVRRSARDSFADLLGVDAHLIAVPDAPTTMLSFAERFAPPRAFGRGVDVVHGVKHLVPRRSTALRVLTVHDMLLLDRPHDFGPAKRALLPGPYRRSVRAADLLLCVSTATRSRLVEHDPSANTRAAVSPLATSETLRTSAPVPVPQLVGRRFALVVGDQSTRKNVRTVVAAWPEVVARHPDAVLALVGPPSWGDTALGRQFESLRRREAVVTPGQVSDGELRWLYEHAVATLCPSLAEGFGLPAAEALDVGGTVLISDDAALREVAAASAAAVVPALDVAAWEHAISEVMAAGPPHSKRVRHPTRTWADVAEDSVRAVHGALQRSTEHAR